MFGGTHKAGRIMIAAGQHTIACTAGCGIEGIIHGHEIWMGSAAWLRSRNLPVASRPQRAVVSEGEAPCLDRAVADSLPRERPLRPSERRGGEDVLHAQLHALVEDLREVALGPPGPPLHGAQVEVSVLVGVGERL